MEEIIGNVRIAGPHIVATKHVALPHVEPEVGALSVALGVGVLNSTIEFGNRDNDPVKYILSLSATDNQTHLCAVAEFLEMSNKQEFSDILNQAENSDQVMVYLKENQW